MDYLRKFLGRKKTQKPEEPLVLVFIPALVTILKAAEDKKRAPLDENEVLSIRDSAVCIALNHSEAVKMVASRGYPDLVAEDAWEEWSKLRDKL